VVTMCVCVCVCVCVRFKTNTSLHTLPPTSVHLNNSTVPRERMCECVTARVDEEEGVCVCVCVRVCTHDSPVRRSRPRSRCLRRTPRSGGCIFRCRSGSPAASRWGALQVNKTTSLSATNKQTNREDEGRVFRCNNNSVMCVTISSASLYRSNVHFYLLRHKYLYLLAVKINLFVFLSTPFLSFNTIKSSLCKMSEYKILFNKIKYSVLF